MMQVLQYLLVVCISFFPLGANAKLPKVLENLNATVLVVAENKIKNPFDTIIQEDQKDKDRQTPIGLGTGVVISGNGIIITNHHVIEGAENIFVHVYSKTDTKKYPVKVIGVDAITDIAVLQITTLPLPKSISSVTWAEEITIAEIGDDIYTIGHPQGMGWTVSKGVIGHTERNVTSPWQTFIQHDSLIMPGNSGGGMFDEQGHLAGINTILIPSRDQTNTQAWSLSVTIEDVKWSFERIMKYGKPRRPALNVTVDYDDKLKQLSITPNSGSNAEKSGITGKNILLKVNNAEVTSYPELFKILKTKKDGDSITVETFANEKVSTYTFELENWNILGELEVKTD